METRVFTKAEIPKELLALLEYQNNSFSSGSSAVAKDIFRLMAINGKQYPEILSDEQKRQFTTEEIEAYTDKGIKSILNDAFDKETANNILKHYSQELVQTWTYFYFNLCELPITTNSKTVNLFKKDEDGEVYLTTDLYGFSPHNEFGVKTLKTEAQVSSRFKLTKTSFELVDLTITAEQDFITDLAEKLESSRPYYKTITALTQLWEEYEAQKKKELIELAEQHKLKSGFLDALKKDVDAFCKSEDFKTIYGQDERMQIAYDKLTCVQNNILNNLKKIDESPRERLKNYNKAIINVGNIKILSEHNDSHFEIAMQQEIVAQSAVNNVALIKTFDEHIESLEKKGYEGYEDIITKYKTLSSEIKNAQADASVATAATYSTVIKHFSDQITNLIENPKLTIKQITKSAEKLDKELTDKPPMKRTVKAAICGVIGALVGFVVGLTIGAAVTSWGGGFGALPGAILGAVKGFTLGTTVGLGTAGFTAAVSGSVGLFTANRNQKKYAEERAAKGKDVNEKVLTSISEINKANKSNATKNKK
ncbi:MAG: hypothetical protein P4M12_11910 [Gammaproteobacteria bacterium]|nr:hypothetical protein [Gammaproteobacteria bacterium]